MSKFGRIITPTDVKKWGGCGEAFFMVPLTETYKKIVRLQGEIPLPHKKQHQSLQRDAHEIEQITLQIYSPEWGKKFKFDDVATIATALHHKYHT